VTKVEIYAVNYAEERKQKPVESVVMQRQQKQPSSYFLMQDQNHCVGVCVCVCASPSTGCIMSVTSVVHYEMMTQYFMCYSSV